MDTGEEGPGVRGLVMGVYNPGTHHVGRERESVAPSVIGILGLVLHQWSIGIFVGCTHYMGGT